MLRLALYQPEIPHNTGALLRLAACLGVAVEIIEPCGFLWEDRKLQRAGLDYSDLAAVTRHRSWERFQAEGPRGRRILLTTKAPTPYTAFPFQPDDLLLLGRESSGVPESVHAAVEARLTIPLRPEARSLNLATAAALVLGEALRQTGQFPTPPKTTAS